MTDTYLFPWYYGKCSQCDQSKIVCKTELDGIGEVVTCYACGTKIVMMAKSVLQERGEDKS